MRIKDIDKMNENQLIDVINYFVEQLDEFDNYSCEFLIDWKSSWESQTFNDDEMKDFLKELIEVLNELDEEDYFGTWGWKDRFNFNEF